MGNSCHFRLNFPANKQTIKVRAYQITLPPSNMSKKTFADRRAYHAIIYIAFYITMIVAFFIQYISGYIDSFILVLWLIFCLLNIGRNIGTCLKTHNDPIATIDGNQITLRVDTQPGLMWPKSKKVTFQMTDVLDFDVVERWWGLRDDYVIQVDYNNQDTEFVVRSWDLYPDDRNDFIELLNSDG